MLSRRVCKISEHRVKRFCKHVAPPLIRRSHGYTAISCVAGGGSGRQIREAEMSDTPDDIGPIFQKYCPFCSTWNEVTVHRMPTDGHWDESHPYFCASCGKQLGS